MAIRSAAEPLIRVTLNLYEADYLRLKQMYPNNFTTYLRTLLRNHLIKISTDAISVAETLGDEIIIE